jgi:uncharacterized protein
MNEFALVTGASSGIGYYFALELAKRKINVLITARSEQKLMELKELISRQYAVQCHWLALDLSYPASPQQLVEWCVKNNFSVSILINNAGYGLWGYFKNQKWEELQDMMHVNMHSLVALCHHFIPLLQANRKAYILNVSSTSAYQAVPTMSVYAASKSFVLQFTRGLRHELKGTSISVSCLSPGPTLSNFIHRAGLQAIKERADKFSMTGEEVARRGLSAMFKGKTEIIPGFVNWLTAQLTRLVPKSITEKIAAGLYKEAVGKSG